MEIEEDEGLSKYHGLLLPQNKLLPRLPSRSLKEAKAAKEYDRSLNPFLEATQEDTPALAAMEIEEDEGLSKYHGLLLPQNELLPRLPSRSLKEAKAAKEYDRFLNPFLEATQEDTPALAALVWKLRAAIYRAKHLVRYYFWWRRPKIGEVLQELDRLALQIDDWCNENLHTDNRTFHLSTLREPVDQLEDMLDDIEYIQLKHRNAKVKVMQRATYSLTLKFGLIMKLRKLKGLLQNLHDVVNEFRKDFSPPNIELTASGSMSTTTESMVSHKTKEQLLKNLLEEGHLVVPYNIAQEKSSLPVHDIFHDERVRDHFELLLCVRVSDRHRTTVPREKTMAESIMKLMNSSAVNTDELLTAQSGAEWRRLLNKKVDGDWPSDKGSTSDSSHGGDVKELQHFIEKEIFKKKLLLVLDDVLEDQLPRLDDLLSAVSRSSLESKIVITSQSSKVLQSIKGIKILPGNIQHDIPWHFFESFVFSEQHMLEKIGKDVAKHLQQFPLAAKMIGKMLNIKRDYKFWTAISQKVLNVVTSLGSEQHQLLSLLKLCYDELTGPLSLCFQYCSLFPNDWIFTPETLVQLWMSQGFLTSIENEARHALGCNGSDDKKTLEDVGMGYFNELHSRSFFEKLTYNGDTSFYMMHASIHCLAQIVAGEEFMRIDSDFHQPNEARLVRHLSIKSTSLRTLFNVDSLFRLRSLIIFGPVNTDASNVLTHIMDRLRMIRTLDLAGCDIKSFPKLDADYRKHLRYLSFYDTGLMILPKGFCKLLNLQVVNIQGCRLKKLPRKVNRLCNLRHITGPTLLTSTISRIGRLQALQELEEFQVSKKHKIQQLGGIKDLAGSIAITNLEKVKCADAGKARLCEKKKLNTLKLEWSPTLENNMSKVQIRLSNKVLERLRPPSTLHDLEIDGYIGVKSPSWFTANVLHNVVYLKLRNCTNWVEPPPLGQLPLLKMLKLEKWDTIKSVGKGFYVTREVSSSDVSFPNLEEISLEDMPELEVWENCHQSFPCLQRLTIRNCPNLKFLPHLQSSKLAEICVEDVGLEDLPLLITVDDQGSSVSHLNEFWISKSVTRLSVRRCSNLTNVGAKNEDVSYLPSSLQYLLIVGCEKMERIGFKAQVSLQELHIEGCKQLEVINFEGDLPSLHTMHIDMIPILENLHNHLVCLEVLVIQDSTHESLKPFERILDSPLLKTLKKLCLINCQNIIALPNSMKKFSSLKSLQLKQCKQISSLPYLPFNLDELLIDECPLLEERCHEDGPDWIKIYHIPYKSI